MCTKKITFSLLLLLLCVIISGCSLFGGGSDTVKKLTMDSSVNDEVFTKVIDLVQTSVPEIATEVESLHNSSQKGVDLILRLESGPTPDGMNIYETNYYWVYVGFHQNGDIIKYWNFVVSKDTEEVLGYSNSEDDYLSLDKWREQLQ